jgi:hypothetical protein
VAIGESNQYVTSIEEIAEYFRVLCTGCNVCATLPVVHCDSRTNGDEEYES